MKKNVTQTPQLGCSIGCVQNMAFFCGSPFFPLIFTNSGTADIFREFMVSLYVKGKKNGHVQAYAPTGAMGLKR
ncbi:MAG: hypothetical protein ACI4BG_08635, partial [Prevotella sp.]